MLGTFSFEFYFTSYCCFTVGSLEFLEIANQSRLFHLLPACLLCSSGRRRCAAPPAALGRLEATSCSRCPPTRHARAAAALLPLTLELPRSATHPNRPPAATSPPSWLARCSTPGPQLAHALAPRAPQHSIPLFPSPLPRPQTPEHHPPSPLPPLSRVSPWSHHPSHP